MPDAFMSAGTVISILSAGSESRPFRSGFTTGYIRMTGLADLSADPTGNRQAELKEEITSNPVRAITSLFRRTIKT
jgi:hypothetical protein